MLDADAPTTEPSEIRSGDTIKWRREDLAGDYPASAGWSLIYYLVNSDGQEVITAAAYNTDAFLITITAAESAAYTSGTYKWTSKVVKSTEKYTDRRGTIEILPDLAAASSGLETRSDTKVALDNMNTIIKNVKKHNSYSIGGRAYSLRDLPELRKEKNALTAEYNRELRRERIKSGKKGGGNKVLTRY